MLTSQVSWALQKEHRQGVRARFEGAVADIRRTMESMADVFAGDSDDVHAEWVKYTHKVGAARPRRDSGFETKCYESF